MGFTHFANVEDMCARLIFHLIYANWDSLMDNKILEQGPDSRIRWSLCNKTYLLQAFLWRLRGWRQLLIRSTLNHHPEWQNV